MNRRNFFKSIGGILASMIAARVPQALMPAALLPWTGILYDVKFWPRALTDSEIEHEFQGHEDFLKGAPELFRLQESMTIGDWIDMPDSGT